MKRVEITQAENGYILKSTDKPRGTIGGPIIVATNLHDLVEELGKYFEETPDTIEDASRKL